MKKITSVIRKSKYKSVKNELSELGITCFFGSDLKFDCNISKSNFLKELLFPSLEHVRCSFFVIVPDTLEYQAIQTILQTCYTKDLGDGMIFVSNINESYRIDDQQSGEQALDFNTI